MANLENKSFSPDNICLPPGQPAVLVEFPTGSDYASMDNHPGMAFPPVFAGMGGQDYSADYGALVAGINDFNQQMFDELQNIKTKTPELISPINLSIEDIGMGGLTLNTQAPANAGNTSVNIGGNTLNIGGANVNVGGGGGQHINQFLFPPERGVRRASVIPAMAMTDIKGRDCIVNTPGVGMANLLYRLTAANITNEMENAFVQLRDKIAMAKASGDWDGVQALAQQWSNLLHAGGGLVQDPDFDGQDDTLTQMVFNISNADVEEGTSLLVSPDSNGQFWVVVAACGDC